MKRKFSASTSPMRLFGLGCLVAALAGSAGLGQGSDKPHFAGQWTFNPSQSDNANDKIQDAQHSSQMSQRGSGGGGYPGGGYPGGGGGYPGGGGIGMGRGGIGMGGGGMGRGGMGRGGPRSGVAQGGGINGEDLEALATDPKTLTIGQNEQQFSISDDTGRERILYADGKKHKEQDSSTQKTTTIKTQWDGNRLVSESKVHSGKLTETYELSPDGKQLIYTSRLDSSNLAGPLTIRRVYDSSANHPQ